MKNKEILFGLVLLLLISVGCGNNQVSENIDKIENGTENVVNESINGTEVESEPEIELEKSASSYTCTDYNKIMYIKSSVNVYDLPSSEGNKIGQLSKSQEVTVTGQCNETSWYRIDYNARVAYVDNKHIEDIKVDINESNRGNNNNNSENTEEVILKNADHSFFEVFLVEHSFKNNKEYYYYGFYMPYGCDTNNSPEFDIAYSELMGYIKGDEIRVFYGLDGEFADLGQYSFYRIGYEVPTENIPETLSIMYKENGYGPQYYFYYKEEEYNTEAFLDVYSEFKDKYEIINENGYNNIFHNQKYFADGTVMQITAYVNWY